MPYKTFACWDFRRFAGKWVFEAGFAVRTPVVKGDKPLLDSHFSCLSVARTASMAVGPFIYGPAQRIFQSGPWLVATVNLVVDRR